MTVWIVGKYILMHESSGMEWEFQGVFSSEQKAVDACLGHDEWFVAPAELDKELPAEKVDWPGFYYPAERNNGEVGE